MSDPIYDQRVQDVLDQYWPGTTDLTEIKGGDDIVYTAMYENEKVIVKSTPYNEKTYNQTLLFKDFLNFMEDGEVDVAYYIGNGVEHSDDMSLTITMSLFATGVAPKDLPPNAPYSWFTEESAIRASGEYWGRFRARSIEFTKAYPEEFEAFQSYKNAANGFFRLPGAQPDIEITDETFGIIHGDAHTGNYFFENIGTSDETLMAIDMDNMQKSWFVIDIGTVTWTANMGMWFHYPLQQKELLSNFKEWFLEEYQWPTTAEELTAGCNYRRAFMDELISFGLVIYPKDSPEWYATKAYHEMNKHGLIPTC